MLPTLVNVDPGCHRVVHALRGLEVHVPFETRPVWQQRELQIAVGPRWPALIEQSPLLARYGLNLPNAFHELKNMGGDLWQRVIASARLGLGDDVRDFILPASGRGRIELAVVLGSEPEKPMPAEFLSEGQISFLGFIALSELQTGRSALAFDEPELHLHPALLARVVWMLERAAETAPVILATHSDRLLDALADPAGSVVLCDLDDQRATRIRRPDPAKLAEWLTTYRGIGSLRAEGYESHVFSDPVARPRNPAP